MARSSKRRSDAGPLPGGERIAPLACLPVFFGLDGREVVVAGGGEAAAWKAELASAAGARVRAVAATHCDAMRALAGHRGGGGSVALVERPWRGDDLAGAVLAICDAADESDAADFRTAGRAAGVPVNVVDRPAFCDFQFGSIANRSPVVVGISTDGAAPILGQAIRRRIETLIPASLGMWSAAAKVLRGSVAARFDARVRRRFWERFADLALRERAGSESEAIGRGRVLVDEVGQDATATGQVALIIAGSGDRDLLAIGAVRELQSADVIHFDRSVGEGVLELARREARRVRVEVRGPGSGIGGICDAIVERARDGERIVCVAGRVSPADGWAARVLASARASGVATRTIGHFESDFAGTPRMSRKRAPTAFTEPEAARADIA